MDEAEAAFWDGIVSTILAARAYAEPYAVWPGVELAAIPDPSGDAFHVVERSNGAAMAWRVGTFEEALLAFLGRLRLLIPEPAHA
jgi:hypothetical protein